MGLIIYSEMMMPKMDELMLDEVTELVKSIRNRCEVFLTVSPMPIHKEHLPTLLEDIYTDAQEIIDGYCKVNDGE